MEQIMEELASARPPGFGGSDFLTYILISPRQHSSLALAYEELCQSAPDSQWILPVRPKNAISSGEERFSPDEFLRFTVFFWEVAYDYSQVS